MSPKLFSVVVSLLFLTGFIAQAEAQTFVVKRVIDGDIIELNSGDQVRLIGIDAPESRATQKAKAMAERTGKRVREITAVGKKSQRFLKELIEGKKVRLEFDAIKRNDEGMLLAYVYDVESLKGKSSKRIPQEWVTVNGEDVFINATIVKSGYAMYQVTPPNIKHTKMFQKLFYEAKQEKRGLWQ